MRKSLLVLILFLFYSSILADYKMYLESADDYCEKGDYNMAVVYYQKAYDEKPSDGLKNLISSTEKIVPPAPAADVDAVATPTVSVVKELLIYIPDRSFSFGIIGLSRTANATVVLTPTATVTTGLNAVSTQPKKDGFSY
jgi:hypothetical protein